MYNIEQNRDFFDKPLTLSPEERANPMNVISCFFTDMTLSDVRINLQALYDAATTGDLSTFSDASERKNIKWFVGAMTGVAEAAYILYKMQEAAELVKKEKQEEKE